MSDKETPETLIALGKKKDVPDFPVRFSFLNAHKARLPRKPKPGELPKFSTQVVISKKSPQLKMIDKAMRAAAAEHPATKGEDYDTLDLILRDGDNKKENKKGYEYLKGCYFFNASCGEKYPPQVVGTRKVVVDEATGKMGLERLTERDIKSGDYGAVTVNFFGYEANGKKGVAAGLRNMQKLRSGESLAGITSADDDFDAEDDEDGDEDFMK